MMTLYQSRYSFNSSLPEVKYLSKSTFCFSQNNIGVYVYYAFIGSFIPFGIEREDSIIPFCYECFFEVTLPAPLPFLGSTYSQLFVSNINFDYYDRLVMYLPNDCMYRNSHC